VPSSSLIPDDPSVLLTTAGMQQFKPYYTDPLRAEKDFGSRSTASVQKSFRTSDIDEVGDASHLTFFEMLGNFSFGGYFKKEAIGYAREFITKTLGLEISFVTVFEGLASIGVPEDTESQKIWKALDPAIRIERQGVEDVFWGPTGSSGPCGPTTEIYCRNANNEDIEVWNIVFNEFFFPGSREELLGNLVAKSPKKLESLKHPGVDTGMGLERLAMIAQKTRTIFETDLFASFIEKLTDDPPLPISHQRVIIDHLRGSVFLLADGVRPSNKEAGYVLRRLLRRAFVYEKIYTLSPDIFESILLAVIEQYGSFYGELREAKNSVINEYWAERERFSKTLERGVRELTALQEPISPAKAFRLYETYGIPFEIIKELGVIHTLNLTREDFDKEFRKHQEKSRAGAEKKFGGHGLLFNTGELKAADKKELAVVTRLHTATHLLHAALRKVLGNEVQQMGSDITAERTRFDFSFGRKVTREELDRVEGLVNKVVKDDYKVDYDTMKYDEAIKSGALHFFKEKYPDSVKVYTIIHPETGEVFSREFCGGPHVKHTGEIGTFVVIKEEASSSGVRRIRAVVK